MRWGKEGRGKSESERGEKQIEGSESISALPTVSQENGFWLRHTGHHAGRGLCTWTVLLREKGRELMAVSSPSPWRARRCGGVRLSVRVADQMRSQAAPLTRLYLVVNPALGFLLLSSFL